ncbi:MAG: hypothetical protein JST70_17430 [Bacteroidetes bacterium]|nr:hypothetical protein [Bacteroidota bacterium]
MYHQILPDEIKEKYSYAINKAREDRDRYLKWIQDEIDKIIIMITSYDMIFVLGSLGVRFLKATPTAYNQFLANYTGALPPEAEEDKLHIDDDIEVLLEYAMNIATASKNTNAGVIPTQEQLNAIYNQLQVIKTNMNFWELSAEPPKDGNDFDQWLRTSIMLDSINVRGSRYSQHLREVYKEVFEPHNGFLEKIYGFDANDLLDTILKLDSLVFSKVGNTQGSMIAHDRFKQWAEKVGDKHIEEQAEKGIHFMTAFTNENPDLLDPSNPKPGVSSIHLDDIAGYNRLFWVIPETDKEKLIFKQLSQEFGNNTAFFMPPKFKAFLLSDSNLRFKPLIIENGKYYCFSLTLAYRNIFKITENLIKTADAAYFENLYQGNSHQSCKDNYIELKTVALFQKLLPKATFYHSLNYTVVEDGLTKATELDILGISSDTAYVIEVKAGELNLKHRRGALKGLKDRLEETINEGSYQCYRAVKYIEDNATPTFTYVEGAARKTLVLDKSNIKTYQKISVTFEHFSSISANLRYLINSGVLSPVYKWAWIVSLYDLMVFADLITSEDDFKEYLQYRIGLYEREDIKFYDEVDILGFFFDGNFPLGEEKKDQMNTIVGFSGEIDSYYTSKELIGKTKDKPERRKKA